VVSVFGSARVAVALSMILTSWIGGYLMVSLLWTCDSSVDVQSLMQA
jgi:hypothetical protein